MTLIAYRLALPGAHPVYSGWGAHLYGARWNSPGRAAIYASLSYGACLLEQMVHLGRRRFPRALRYVEIRIPPSVSRFEVNALTLHGWEQTDMAAARAAGDAWLKAGKFAVMITPSVPAPLDRNVVINPAHPDAEKIKIGAELPIVTDPRLLALE